MIQPEDAQFPEQKELLQYMQDNSLKVRLVAKLLHISESYVYFYRRGAYAKVPLRFPQEKLNELKKQHKLYLKDQLKGL